MITGDFQSPLEFPVELAKTLHEQQVPIVDDLSF